jgi:hypothetical protein
MHIFINETSFHEQFETRRQFERAVARFIGLVDEARSTLARLGGCMWRSQWLEEARALLGETLKQSLHDISGKELRENFLKVVYDKANPAPWEPKRLHNDEVLYLIVPAANEGDVSLVEGETVNNTSVAELAERRLVAPAIPGGLIGLEQSRYFSVAEVHVLKVEHARIPLRSWCRIEDFKEWVRLNFPEVPAYAPDAPDPPRDEQTCLADRTVYEYTGRSSAHDRKIYKHKTNRQLYYVDNFHNGAAAHLEVFDKTGAKHLGEASLKGVLDKSKAKKGRSIDV